jgi:hypothetical protein
VASLVGFFVTMTVVLLIPFALIMWGISHIMRKRTQSARTVAIVLAATLMFTPGWGPATIMIVPVPFGVLFLASLVTFRWNELFGVMDLAPMWYIVAFPATALAAYGCRRLLLSNFRWGV